MGSNLTEEGKVEGDASLMIDDGCFGAVGACPGINFGTSHTASCQADCLVLHENGIDLNSIAYWRVWGESGVAYTG